MRNRFLTLSAVAALVPTLAIAQQRPAPAPAPAARPAAQPAQQPAARPAQPAPARPAMAAQGPDRSNAWEFTVAGSLFSWDQNVATYVTGSNVAKYLFGGTVGLTRHVTDHLGIGASIAAGANSGSRSVIVPSVDLTWASDINSDLSVIIPVGFGVEKAKGTRNTATSTYGVHGGLGILKFLNEGTALRIDARMSYDHYSEAALSGSKFNGQGNVGLSFFPNAGPPKDSDGDGVPDSKDRCPNTPHGAIVDANGCPRDSDHDGVYDGIDRCPNTPPNTPVDQYGCPRDTDGDGVPDNLDKCPNTPRGTPVYPISDVARAGCPVDTDGDGVPDNLDKCPNTPRGVPVYPASDVARAGCPLDSDGDGVNDAEDKCPNTPPQARPVYPSGHAQAGCPVDTDGDGVPDYLDRCPNTAAGTRVDANGCPIEPDSDHDGVPDSRDRCPNTPANVRVDANGCPLADLPAATQVMVLRSVGFQANVGPRATRLTLAATTALDGIATAIQYQLRATPSAKYEVGSYTDRGTPAATQRVTDARAQAVVAYLTSKGVPASALTAHGYGTSNPKVPNTTAANRAQNRRIELKRTA